MAPPIITVIGSLNIDLVTRTPRVPSGGETLTATSFQTGSGGKGANQAVACARLSRTRAQAELRYSAISRKRKISDSSHVERDSVKELALLPASQSGFADEQVMVRMVGAVGDDEFGRTLISGLERDGVNTSAVAVRHGGTGVAVIIVEESTGENRILLSPNANQTVGPEIFPLTAPVPDLIVLQLEIPLETVLHVIEKAAEGLGGRPVPVLFNPAPAVELPTEIFAKITHLNVNETEAAILSGNPADSLTDEAGIAAVAKVFLKRGVQNVVITLGSKGCYYASSTGDEGLVPAQKVKVVDTTAAGDTFVGAYAVEVVKQRGEKFDIRRAIERALKASAMTVQKEGAQSAIPWLDEVS